MKLSFTLFPLDNSPGFLIYKTATMMKAELSRAFHTAGFAITPEQWAVLSRLWESEGESQTVLAERTAKDRHNITRILDLLEKNGLVRREPDPEDRRYRRIFLTDEGKDLKGKLTPIVKKHLSRAFSGLDREDVDQLTRIHEHIVENLGESAP
ncbi:MAG: MarR family winged helix-turn-helix transcriptional regulator [Desulfomonilaceae bacterium]